MAVKFYDLLRPVLASRMAYVAQDQKLSANAVRDLILAEAERNQTEWFSDRVPNLNYRKPECRLAYLYIVAAANANTFKWILSNDKSLKKHVLEAAKRKRRLKVCAFGAGPGTELMACAKFFDEQKLGYPVRVDFQLLDIVKEWQDSWYAIRDAIDSHFETTLGVDTSKWPIVPTGNFTKQDVTDTDGLGDLGDIWTHDVFVINFLLSEIFTDDPGFHAFVAAVTNRAPVGSRFVFIERKGSMWAARMSKCAAKAGMKLSDFKPSKEYLDADESPDLLGKIYRQLSTTPNGKGRSPRNGWNVIYSIGVKE
jgi:hypothetical protein